MEKIHGEGIVLQGQRGHGLLPRPTPLAWGIFHTAPTHALPHSIAPQPPWQKKSRMMYFGKINRMVHIRINVYVEIERGC